VNTAIRARLKGQHGNVTRRQLLQAGLSKGGIEKRLENGSFVVRHRAVYALAPARQDPPALIAAAVLAGGPNAVASHVSEHGCGATSSTRRRLPRRPARFRDDRERDAENLKHGPATMRMTTDRLKVTRGHEAERLMEIYTGLVSLVKGRALIDKTPCALSLDAPSARR
jgi:hypothetical protein